MIFITIYLSVGILYGFWVSMFSYIRQQIKEDDLGWLLSLVIPIVCAIAWPLLVYWSVIYRD